MRLPTLTAALVAIATFAPGCVERVQQTVSRSEVHTRTPPVVAVLSSCVEDVLLVRVEEEATCTDWMFEEVTRPRWQASETTANLLEGRLGEHEDPIDALGRPPDQRNLESHNVRPGAQTEWWVSTIDADLCRRTLSMESVRVDGTPYLTDTSGQVMVDAPDGETRSVEVRGRRWAAGCEGAVPVR